ncbi:MAG: alpha/beta hydrolase-fold protein [Nannocystaceae bacterium]
MPRHNFRPLQGRIEYLEIESTALQDNLLDDPHRRQTAIYLPAGYDATSDDYPLFLDLAGFTGSGLKHLAWQAFGESLPQRVDRLTSHDDMGPVILVLPDCFTSLGGNQYVNSIAMGRWEDYLLQEVVPLVEQRYRVRSGPGHRAVFGRSSGGYGALIQGMRHGEHWGAVACHSGDMNFDILYRSDLPRTLDVLARHERSVERFLTHLESEPKLTGNDTHALMILAMAASYAPEADAPRGVRLPVDLWTCALDDRRWRRWLEHDPLTLIEQPSVQDSLRRLSGLFIDCGSYDQYAIHYGTRALARRLDALGIKHTHEEFADNHSGVEYRLDRSLPFLYRAVG